MRVIYSSVVDGPITHTKYIRFIKDCCIRVPEYKEYIGACVKVFKDSDLNEKKNFKLTICGEFGLRLVSLKVKGGLGGLTRTKYRMDNESIYRYDWRQDFWTAVKLIGAIFLTTIRVFAIFNPTIGQIEYFNDQD